MRIERSRLRAAALAAAITLATSLAATGAPPARDESPDATDSSVKPGDDFYRYANANWLKWAAAHVDQPNYANGAAMIATTSARVRDLVEGAAASRPPKGGVAQKVGDYYAGLLDLDAIKAKGLAPLGAETAKISAIGDKTSLSAYLGATLNVEADGLVSAADHVFGLWVSQSLENGDRNFAHLTQGGLGLSDRESYLDASAEAEALRAKYRAHVAAVLKLAGLDDADARAARVVALETEIARSHAPDADAADASKQNNTWARADFGAKAPGMDWDAYFRAAGLADQTELVVWQPSAVTGTSALVARAPLDAWKDYLRFRLVEHYAAVLPDEIAAEDFAFYGTALSGARARPERRKVALDATQAALGQAVGRLYTDKYFPPEAKAKAKAMAADLVAACRARISGLAWMSAETKRKAIAKLDAFTLGVGYPDVWVDYASLDVERGDAFGNLRRAEAFHRSRALARLKGPVDPAEWRIDPQSVGAIIMFSPNAEFFSAGILQPPYFDPDGDAASNYGSAGAGMAHEITHSFDELGNIYDDRGRLASWWTADDLARYRAETAKLVAQFDGLSPLPGLRVDGKRISGESVADLAGLRIAYDAYVLSLKGKPDATIGGLTGDQRFFLAFARRWRRYQTEDALRRQVATDNHATGEYRSDTVRNVDAWYRAFGVAPGDKLYLRPEDRVGIW